MIKIILLILAVGAAVVGVGVVAACAAVSKVREDMKQC